MSASGPSGPLVFFIMDIRVNLTFGSVYFSYRSTRYPDTWVSLFLFYQHYNMLTRHWLGLRLLAWQGELFPTLLVVQGGQLFLRSWIIGNFLASTAYLSPVSQGTHIDTILPPGRTVFFF